MTCNLLLRMLPAATLGLAITAGVAAPVAWDAHGGNLGWNSAEARRGGASQSGQPSSDDPAGHDVLEGADDNGATQDTSGHNQRRRGR
jgi:hypothetical protein